MDFKIEKNIPFPSQAAVYPFDQMEVGDSFVAPLKVMAHAYSYAKKNKGVKFAKRNMSDEMIRIWRIA